MRRLPYARFIWPKGSRRLKAKKSELKERIASKADYKEEYKQKIDFMFLSVAYLRNYFSILFILKVFNPLKSTNLSENLFVSLKDFKLKYSKYGVT